MRGIFVGIVVAVVCFFSTAQLQAASYQMHTVKAEETYFKISRAYGVGVEALQTINYQAEDNLMAGDLIKISQIKDIKVKVNGQYISFDTQPYIENGRVFVPVRFVSEALESDSIGWNQQTKTAVIKDGSTRIVVNIGSSTAYINGKAVRLDAPVQFYNSRTFVPVRFFSESLGVDSIAWDQNTYTVSIKKDGVVVNPANITPSYSDEDLYWLSRLVNAEAEAESFEGKVAVANTIINRKNSPEYPDTIKGVIFDTNFGTQYTPVDNGHIYNTPSQESIDAAKQALQGYNNIGACMYFLNPSESTSSWIQNNRTYYKTIGNHDFYL